jgi:hypothetical protein
MPANTVSITPRVPKSYAIAATTAQTDLTGATATNIVTLMTAAATGTPPADGQGAILQDFRVRIPATCVAATVALYKKVSGTRFLLYTLLIPATTVSNTVAPYDSGKIQLNEFVAPGDTIDVLTNVTQTCQITGNGGEY